MSESNPSGEPAAQPSSEPNVVRNTGLAIAAQVVTAAFTAVLTLYLTRKLAPHKFGEFSLVVGVVGVLLVVADLGIASSAGRFLAEQRRDRKVGSAFLRNAVTLKLITASVVSGALFAAAGPLADAYGNHSLTWPFRAAALVLFGQTMFSLFSSALVSIGRIGANLGVYTAESAAETTLSVALVAFGGGALGATFGRAAGYIVGALAAALLTYRVFDRRAGASDAPNRSQIMQISRYAGVLFVVNGVWALLSQTDILLIGAYVGITQVGFFSAPMRLANLLHYPGLAVQNSVAPRMARGPGVEPDVESFRGALRYLVILQAGVLAVVLVWADPIIALLLGKNYGPSAPVLRSLAPFIYFQGLGPLVSVGVSYMGESRRRIPIALGALAIQILLSVILIPRLGAVGGGIATSVAYVFYTVGHLLICRYLLSMSLRPFLISTVRSLAAGAAGAAVLAVAGTHHLTPAGWLAGGAGGVVVFIAVLFATREITVSEVRAVREAVAEAVPGPRKKNVSVAGRAYNANDLPSLERVLRHGPAPRSRDQAQGIASMASPEQTPSTEQQRAAAVSPGADWIVPADTERSFAAYISAIWAGKWIVIAVVVAALAGAVAYVEVASKVYQAHAQLLITPLPANASVAGLGLIQQSAVPQNDIETGAGFVTTTSVAQRVVGILGSKQTPQHLLTEITVSPVANTDDVDIAAQASTPAQAVRLADAFANATVADRTAALNTLLNQRIATIKGQITSLGNNNVPAKNALEAQLGQYETLQTGSNPNVRVQALANLPTSATSPKKALTLVAGLVGGIVAGVGLVFLIQLLDPRLRREDELREGFKLPILARVPRAPRRTRKRRGGPMVPNQLTPEAHDAFRTLRAVLSSRKSDNRGGRTVLVTGPTPFDGKSTTAINLAATLAASDERVLLIEGDIRRPSIGAALNIAMPEDAASPLETDESVLFGRFTLEDALVDTALAEGENSPHLRMLLAPHRNGSDAPPMSPAAFRAMLTAARSITDWVVIDAPPLIYAPELLSASGMVDDVILVVRLGNTNLGNLTETAEMLAQYGIRPTGFVVMGTSGHSEYY
ncbi:MAG TPA: oligosaccharide flippase family protein [Solirubrobacteraceae bacterium]|nr:oligosaccharide flippase family protein [Solirubrobacteraceae bacterium]